MPEAVSKAFRALVIIDNARIKYYNVIRRRPARREIVARKSARTFDGGSERRRF